MNEIKNNNLTLDDFIRLASRIKSWKNDPYNIAAEKDWYNFRESDEYSEPKDKSDLREIVNHTGTVYVGVLNINNKNIMFNVYSFNERIEDTDYRHYGVYMLNSAMPFIIDDNNISYRYVPLAHRIDAKETKATIEQSIRYNALRDLYNNVGSIVRDDEKKKRDEEQKVLLVKKENSDLYNAQIREELDYTLDVLKSYADSLKIINS